MASSDSAYYSQDVPDLPVGMSHRGRPESSTMSTFTPRNPSNLSIGAAIYEDQITPMGGSEIRKQSRPFKSYRLRGEREQPWVTDPRMKRTRVGNWIVFGFIVVGTIISGYIMYTGVSEAKLPDQCLIMEDNFENINKDNWGYEIQTGGYGNGEFDWTTDDPKNSFVDAEGLHIVPTLTTESTGITEAQLVNGYTLNITKSQGDGSCTSPDYMSCGIRSNQTLGTILPPVRSARMTTKGKKSIKYGRIEVVARAAKGDWLWPAIWMMPEDNVYGDWPASGEIDIAEFRGNAYTYPEGRDFVASTLHWGPDYKHDAYIKTHSAAFLRRADFATTFHTFGLEWSENYIFMYLDNRLKQVMYTKYSDKNKLWEKGDFASLTTSNGTLYQNPWQQGGKNAPFDQKFYLILNVAVGAQNGWFWDGEGTKPWVDGSDFAARDFWNARNDWLPTWGEGNERGMTVKSVKMWQAGKC
ncbi:gram-negative bacteria-binding protein 1 precursor [Clathrospora elynae]|uniref:Gram-negative bacteria-binding protein 1 n=1 Tax=Clathrospora elynae TaxID=706981 RepID=A0A6A5SY77_9PLEO|nr:gram-negative bacteria-binding protein 1 precursor [Clathrospora elynae]